MKQKFRLSKKTSVILICFFCISLFFLIWNIVQNQSVHINEITINNDLLPNEFSGFKIVHVSDLHNAEFGENNEDLLSLIKEASPDIIVVTGDIIDSRRPDANIARDFINNVAKISPVYYVTGNHESRVTEENRIDSVALNENITILHNDNVMLKKAESEIQIIGLDDPTYVNSDNGWITTDNELQKYSNNGHFKILLSHRPEFFKVYTDNNMNVVFSGHAHGGQIRLPFIGGLYAPHQGKFPEYDSGLFTENDTNMVVSRGIGNSLFPFRVNNPPEIIVVTLEK